MKFKIVFTPEAQDDLLELYEYIAERGSPERAMAYIARIEMVCMSLEMIPHRGTLREDLRRGLRVMGFERRVQIAFRVKSKSVAILRIFYGGRSVERAFRRSRKPD
jgi:toxin ParE1/3/4